MISDSIAISESFTDCCSVSKGVRVLHGGHCMEGYCTEGVMELGIASASMHICAVLVQMHSCA